MTHSATDIREPLAVVGADAIMPGSEDGPAFWRNILAGRDLISDVPDSHWRIDDYYDADIKARDKTYGRRGGFVRDVPFDPLAFGLPPALLPHTDTSQLLGLIAARRLMDAIKGAPPARDRVGVILGSTTATELMIHMGARMRRPHWEAALRSEGYDEDAVARLSDRIADTFTEWTEDSFPGQLGNVIAGRIANRLDLNGTNVIVDAACAGSLAAIHAAANELYLGDSDMVITGGIDTLNDILMYMCFSKTPAMSPTGDCRPFASNGDGMLLGEGVALFALRRLSDAERDGNPVLAVIRGIGSSSDGLSKSIYAPLPEGQSKAVLRAYDKAGYGPGTVELIEAHGTATLAGDVAEVTGLKHAFGTAGDDRVAEVALGSVKSQVGHTKSAAGAAGLFKAVMAVHHGVLPPTLKVATPNPKLGLDGSPFYVNAQARPWVSPTGQPRRAGVSSFGFGGTNFHVALESYTGTAGVQAPRLRGEGAELLLLSGADAAALQQEAARLIALCDTCGGLSALARETQAGFTATDAARAMVVAGSLAEARDRLATLSQALENAEPGTSGQASADVIWHLGPAGAGKLAFLFPGQGSQYTNMGAELAMIFPQALAVWDQVAAHWPADVGPRLDRLVFPPPAFDDATRQAQQATLTEMQNAQPAIGAMSLSLLAVLETLGLAPDAVAGHSFGEVTALHAAGALSAGDMVTVARQRGALMAASAAETNTGGTRGAMIAVAGSPEDIGATGSLPDGVVLANLNSPRQTVLSGPQAGVDQAADQLKQAGLAVTPLPVSGAFHSPQMAAAVDPFARVLAEDVDWFAPATPVYANVSAAPYEVDPDALRTQLAGQITAPVRFVEMIRRMIADGVTSFVEVGPGAALTGLVRQIATDGDNVQALALDHRSAPLVALWRGLGQLAIDGHALDFAALWQGIDTPPLERPIPPRHAVMINGANVGKPDLQAIAADRRAPPQPPPSPSSQPETDAMSKPSSDQLATLYEIARQTNEAHVAYTGSMTEAHNAFLTLAAQTVAAMGGQEAGATLPAMPQMQMPPMPQAPASTVPSTVQPMAPQPAAPAAAAPSAPQPVVPAPAPQPQAQTVDVAGSVLAAVAEKTGYPVEALSLDMALEADLGIDSIKRVEIFSALSDLSPAAASLTPEDMADVVTLADVMALLGEDAGAAPAAPASQPVAAPAVDPAQAVLAAVAEKTGYPVEALSLDMALEADLGIDSIKRVEIFSALSDLSPAAASLTPEDMADIVTLADVMAAIGTVTGDPPAPEEEPALGEPLGGSVDRLVCSVPDLTPLTDAEGAALPKETVIGVAVYGGLPEGDALCGEIIDALKAAGYGQARAYDPAAPAPVAALVVVACADQVAVPGPDTSLNLHRFVLQCARSAAKDLMAAKGHLAVVQDSGGAFGLAGAVDDRMWFGGPSGLAKTAAREWPEVACQALDLAREGVDPSDWVRRLVAEVTCPARALEVAVDAAGARFQVVNTEIAVPLLADLVANPAACPTLVVTGGARGVTAHALHHLVETLPERTGDPKARLLVLGRSPLPQEPAEVAALTTPEDLRGHFIAQMMAGPEKRTPAQINADVAGILAAREAAATLDALRTAGAEVRYQPVDVRDGSAVADVLALVRADWGGFTGFIHGAGVLEDRAIADKTDAQMEKVFTTKVDGLFHILSALAEDRLELIALFSSIAARHGNPGQCDYAMANEVLNRVARLERQKRGPGCLVRSFNWGPWNGGMVTPELGGLFARRGLGLIDLDAGADLMARSLLDPAFLPDAVELVVHARLAGADENPLATQAHAAQ